MNEVRVLIVVHESEYVVNLLGFFEDETYAYLVMEYIDGVCTFRTRNHWQNY